MIKSYTLKAPHISFQYITLHSTGTFDVCSCVRMNRMKVGDTEQEDFLQAFCRTIIHSIFNAISVCSSLCHSAKPHIILGG